MIGKAMRSVSSSERLRRRAKSGDAPLRASQHHVDAAVRIVSTSRMTMFGWLNRAVACASREISTTGLCCEYAG